LCHCLLAIATIDRGIEYTCICPDLVEQLPLIIKLNMHHKKKKILSIIDHSKAVRFL
jgi:hypothetical protein